MATGEIDAYIGNLAPELVKALNEVQQSHKFLLHLSPTKRVHNIIEKGSFDVLFLTDKKWLPKDVHSHLLESGFSVKMTGVVFTKRKEGIDQSYFDNIERLTKAGVLSYFYQMTDHEVNKYTLAEKYQMFNIKDEMAVVDMVFLEPVDIGIVGSLSLEYLASKKKIDIDSIFVRTEPDSRYDTYMLIKKKAVRLSLTD